MLVALRSSPEKKELVDLAVKYLRGVKGHLVQNKKKLQEKSLQGPGSSIPGVNPTYRVPLNAAQMPPGLSVPRAADVRSGYGPPPQGFGEGIPSTHVPQTYNAPMAPAPASVGSHIMGQGQRGGVAQQQRADGTLEDHDVENALRGFLGT
jgi:hypothetical protein